MIKQFKPGDRVGMAPHFLLSIHDRRRESAAARGFVTGVNALPSAGRSLVQIQWDDGHVSRSLNVNLMLVCNPRKASS